MTYRLSVTQFAGADPLPRDVLASQALDIGSPEPAVSDPMLDETTAIRVVADINCSIGIGSDPAAMLTKRGPLPLSANVPEIFGVAPGDRIAVIIR